MSAIDVAPLYDVRLRTPRLELRLGSEDELLALGRLAEEGVHSPDEMPFAIAWADWIGEPGFMDSFLEYDFAQLANWSPHEWTLNLVAWEDGVIVGTQGLIGEQVSQTRRVLAGSWLGLRYQRRGLGTEMRAAVLELAFRELDATAAESAWLEGNAGSRRVFEKLGYRVVGAREEHPRGEPVATTIVGLEREAWRCPIGVEISGLESCLPLFGLT